MSLLVAALSALISVNGAVAALLPVAVVMSIRLRRSPSQLLLPVAFAAHAGSLLTLSGSPVVDDGRAGGRDDSDLGGVMTNTGAAAPSCSASSC